MINDIEQYKQLSWKLIFACIILIYKVSFMSLLKLDESSNTIYTALWSMEKILGLAIYLWFIGILNQTSYSNNLKEISDGLWPSG